jgi:hypothetical protein
MAASVVAWTLGAAASVAVSLLALSSIDAGSAAGPSQQLAPDTVTRAGSAASTAAPPTSTVTSEDGGVSSAVVTRSAPAPSRAANSVERPLSTSGGTVVARCSGDTAYLVSWSPAQGFRMVDANRGPGRTVEVTFRSATQQFEVEVHCVGGAPALRGDD